MVVRQQITDIQIDHLQIMAGGYGVEYTKLRETEGILYIHCKEYLIEYSYIINKYPDEMFILYAMINSIDYKAMTENVDTGMREAKLTNIPDNLIHRIDNTLKDNNIQITGPARYCEYKKMIVTDEINLLNNILERKYKLDINRAARDAHKTSNSTPIHNVPHTTNVPKKTKYHRKPANTYTMYDIRKIMSKHNPLFIEISTGDLFKMLHKHGLKSVNDKPIYGIGTCHYVYDKDQVNKLLELDIIIQYAKNYKNRTKQRIQHNRTKREVARTLPVVKTTELQVAELISIESISKTINKVMSVDSLAKHGLTPVGKIVNEFGAVSFAYDKKEVEKAKLDSNILDLSNFTQDQLNAIALIAKCK